MSHRKSIILCNSLSCIFIFMYVYNSLFVKHFLKLWVAYKTKLSQPHKMGGRLSVMRPPWNPREVQNLNMQGMKQRVGNEILWENTDKGINCSFSIQVTHQTLGPVRWGNSIDIFFFSLKKLNDFGAVTFVFRQLKVFL